MSKAKKIFIGYVILSTLFKIIVILGPVLYVIYGGPFTIPFLEKYVEYKVGKHLKDTEVTIDNNTMFYDKATGTVQLKLENVLVDSKDKTNFNIKNSLIKFHFKNLLHFGTVADEIELDNIQGKFDITSGSSSSSKFDLNTIFNYNIKITDSNIDFNKFHWNIKELSNNKGHINLISNLNGKESNLKADFDKKEKHLFGITANFKNLPSFILLELFDINYSEFISSGNLKAIYNNKNNILEKLNIDSAGTIENYNYKINANLDNDHLNIDALELASNNTLIKLNGKNLSSPNAELNFTIDNFPISDVYKLWPKTILNDLRSWLIEAINKGNIKKGTGIVKLENKQVDITLESEGINVKYLPEFSEITDIAGIAHFSYDKLTVTANSATSLNTKLSNITLELPLDINSLHIKADSVGEVADFYQFIPQYAIDKLNSFSIAIKDNKSVVKSKINLSIPLKEDLKEEEILLDIDLFSHDNLILSSALSSYPLANSKIRIKNDADLLSINGNTNLSRIDCDFNFAQKHTQDAEPVITAKAMIDNHNLDNFSLNNDLILSQGVNVNFVMNGDKVDVEADLTKPSIVFKKFNFTKPKNIPGKLTMNILKDKDQNILLDEIKLYSNNLRISGTGVIGKDFTKIDFPLFKVAGSVFRIYSEYGKNISKFLLKGPKLDISTSKLSEIFSLKDNDPKDKEVTIDIKELTAKNNVVLHNLNLNLKCNKKHQCDQFNGKVQIGPNKQITIWQAKSKNQKDRFILEADDASVFFKAFDIYTNIEGGNLIIAFDKDVIHENKENFLDLKGSILMKNFQLTQNSFLTKMLLSLTSINIFDLGGSNIKMNKFDANLSYFKDLFEIKKGMMSGLSVSITMNGKVDLAKNNVNIKGEVIPSIYGLNQTISKIPLIGTIISGGDEAAISATYNVTGTLNKTKTSVNPMSLLPLSFFKKLFQ